MNFNQLYDGTTFSCRRTQSQVRACRLRLRCGGRGSWSSLLSAPLTVKFHRDSRLHDARAMNGKFETNVETISRLERRRRNLGEKTFESDLLNLPSNGGCRRFELNGKRVSADSFNFRFDRHFRLHFFRALPPFERLERRPQMAWE